MNDYGYDYYTSNDSIGFDESYYTEMTKPLFKKESFDNMIDSIIDFNIHDVQLNAKKSETEKNNMNSENDDLKNRLLNTSNHFTQTCGKYKHLLKQKYHETMQLNNQLTMFYLLLFISILLIIYQKMSINNLKQLVYIMRINTKYGYDINAPIST